MPNVFAKKRHIAVLCENIISADSKVAGYATAGYKIVHTIEYFQKCRFAAAGRSDESGYFICRDFDADILQRTEIAVPEIAVLYGYIGFIHD